MHPVHTFFNFFTDHFPSLKLIVLLFPFSLLWSFFTLYIAGYFKKRWNWKTGYTRKLFHFFIFFSAVLFQLKFKLPGIFILGWAVTIVVLFACYKGDGNILYEGLAREKDEPFRTKYILYSYLATFFGGVFSNIFFGQFAIFGYAITGIADAIAEPAGIRFGKHRYKVFSFDNKVSYRSIEGSLAVFISAILMIAILGYGTIAFLISFQSILMVAFICTLVEALSPSGFDNMLLQLAASFLCSVLFVYQK